MPVICNSVLKWFKEVIFASTYDVDRQFFNLILRLFELTLTLKWELFSCDLAHSYVYQATVYLFKFIRKQSVRQLLSILQSSSFFIHRVV